MAPYSSQYNGLASPKRVREGGLLLSAACLIAAASLDAVSRQSTAAPSRTVLIRAAQIIDGRGGAPIVNGSVLIRGDRIERVGSAEGMTADQVIDLGSATVL